MLAVLLAGCGGSVQPSQAPASPPGAAQSSAVASKPAPPNASSPASPAGSAPSQLTKINLAYVVPSTLFLWEQVGVKQGLFKTNGLDVSDPVLVSGTPRLAQALLAGDFDVAGTGLEPAVTAAANGNHLEAIASLQPFLGMAIVVPPGSPIQEPAQLKGKTVGLSQTGNSGDSFLSAVMAKAGASRADVTLVQTGSSSAAMAALLAKKVDAAVVGPSDAILAEAQGARTLVDGPAVKVANPQGPVVVNKGWADSHRPAVLALLKTMLQANALYRSSRDQGIKLQQDSGWFKDLPAEALGRIWDVDMKSQVEVPLVDDQAAREMIRSVEAADPQVRGVAPSAVYDNSFLNELIDNGFVKSVFPNFKKT
jgi:ABC-type nitrate/sulfonate/bicarbonate transport system substrate-binding protein